MRSMTLDAAHIAMNERCDGRTTMILVPDASWAPSMYDMGRAPEGIWIRFSDNHSGLKSLPIDTLITICDNDMDQEGLLRAKERLRASSNPKWIRLNRSVEDITLKGREIWK